MPASSTPLPDTLTIRRPDDWHVHLRDGAMLRAVAHYTARCFARAIIMPNLSPPITTAREAAAYRQRILDAVQDPDPRPEGYEPAPFEPLMTAYLTDTIAAEELRRGHGDGIFTAAKLYPAGATTNSDSGVTDVAHIYPVLEAMQDIGMPLLIHGEVTDADIDIFDREAVFIDRTLSRLVRDFPALKIVFEHITTRDAAQFVVDAPETVGATITPHHLIHNRTDIFTGGINPHLYCLPILKREEHRQALRAAATGKLGAAQKFFLGTDSAPHARADKESACGCAGIFNAPHALEAYAKVFAEEDALDRLEAFASVNGPTFYGLGVNEGELTLNQAGTADSKTNTGIPANLVEFAPGPIQWSIAT
ncbi:MAG: dihydroorotase [Pacificimonas sp.]|nr:dihydroorotase [Pacificimonas sp.]